MAVSPHPPRHPPATAAQLRRGVLLRTGLAGLAAAVLLALQRPGFALFVLTAALTLGLASLLSPRFLHPRIERSWRVLGRGLGLVLGTVLLVPFFYLVLTPIGWLTRRGRRDPLGRRPLPAGESYWTPRPGKPAGREDLERSY